MIVLLVKPHSPKSLYILERHFTHKSMCGLAIFKHIHLPYLLQLVSRFLFIFKSELLGVFYVC